MSGKRRAVTQINIGEPRGGSLLLTVSFGTREEVDDAYATLMAAGYHGHQMEKAGLKVNFRKTTDFIVPEEFQNKLDEIPALKTAFDALTLGRQRAYILYFSAPKQSKTRESRVEKCMRQILNGKGLNDE